ncbi:MAG: type II toxin-antitoxin system RelE/ParE family toxin [Bacteroidota bacterium]
MEADQFSYEVTLDAAEEIDQAISHYEPQFSSGAADFLTAFDDTILRILKMPEAGKRRSSKDPDIRGQQLVAQKGNSSYAKKFPYLLIYKVYLAEKNSDLPAMAF